VSQQVLYVKESSPTLLYKPQVLGIALSSAMVTAVRYLKNCSCGNKHLKKNSTSGIIIFLEAFLVLHDYVYMIMNYMFLTGVLF
jgi:hypothetical protein